MTTTRNTIVRGLTVVVTVAFLGVLSYYLIQPGYTWTRLVLFAVLGGLAVVGAAGVVYQRELIAAGSACGLFLVGFLQAVLWIYILPVAGVIVVAAVASTTQERPNSPDTAENT